MRFFNSRHNDSEERNPDADDEDFHSIFEIEGLDSLDLGDIAEDISDNPGRAKETTEQSDPISETIPGDTEVKNSGVKTSDTNPGDNRTIEVFDQTLKIESKVAIVWNNKGVVLSRLGNYTAAIEAFNQALMIEPNYSSAWNNKGVVLSRLGKYSEAIEAYDQALMINPNYSAYENQVTVKYRVSTST